MIRVRAALSDSDFCRKLRGKIPKEALSIPECTTSHKYPCTLLKAFPDEHSSSLLGIVTEELLKEHVIDLNALTSVCKRVNNIVLGENVLKAKTTTRYLENVRNTKNKLASVIGDSTCKYNAAVSMEGCSIEGHPDILTDSAVFEVKTTGQLKQGWAMFLLQTFCYAALYPSAKKIYVVLPLQETVWEWDVTNNWPKRSLFTEVMKTEHPSIKPQKPTIPGDLDIEDELFGPMMFSNFPIGAHIQKKKSLRATLQGLSTRRPYQVFFTQQSTKFTVKDEDVVQSYDYISKTGTKLFVHSPYLLNLCLEPEETGNYVVQCLRQHLQTTSAVGGRGVVVHVGKACKLPLEKALQNMHTNILQCLDGASAECPLLLETPAGQGTETLTKLDEFMRFVESIKDPRFGICIDTCHTFAAGTKPLEYLGSVLENPSWKPYLKLIHFNDSKGACGSCVDRHATLGTGCVSKAQLMECAILANTHGIPMLVE